MGGVRASAPDQEPSCLYPDETELTHASGWPDGIRNVDSRAGAVSEVFEAGAVPADGMRAATHAQMSTTILYNRGLVVQAGRVAELRRARRRAKPGS